MKNLVTLIGLAFILQSQSVFCQEKKEVPLFKNEIGIAFSVPRGNYYIHNRGVELVLTRWKTKSTALRFSAGYISEEQNDINKYSARADTAYNNFSSQRFNYFCAGSGLTFQHNFYKLLYFTAAMDTRLMYANNISQNHGYFMYKEGELIGSYNAESALNASAFKWELNPSVGVKLRGKRLSIGAEITSQMMSMFMSSANSGLGSQFDFKMGHDFTRINFNYRF